MEKKLTIVLPVYNAVRYLPRCLSSVTDEMVQLVIVNDGSTDESQLLLEKYQESYPETVLINTQNQGPSKARKLGLTKVNTKYFCFVDSDDYINMNRYKKLMTKMEQEKEKIGNGRIYLHLSGLRFISRSWPDAKVNFEQHPEMLGNTISILTDKIFHADLLPHFYHTSDLRAYEDAEVSYYVLAKQKTMIHDNHPMYHYCMRPDSTFSKTMDVHYKTGIENLVQSCLSRKQLFQQDHILKQYQESLDGVDIKLMFQRIAAVNQSRDIQNKPEMTNIILDLLDRLVPNWEENGLYQQQFVGSELHDLLNFYLGKLSLRGIERNPCPQQMTLPEIVDQYEKKIKVKKK